MMVFKLLMKIGNPLKIDDSLKISDKRSRPNKILEVNVKLETPISRQFKDATCGRTKPESNLLFLMYNWLPKRGVKSNCGGVRGRTASLDAWASKVDQSTASNQAYTHTHTNRTQALN